MGRSVDRRRAVHVDLIAHGVRRSGRRGSDTFAPAIFIFLPLTVPIGAGVGSAFLSPLAASTDVVVPEDSKVTTKGQGGGDPQRCLRHRAEHDSIIRGAQDSCARMCFRRAAPPRMPRSPAT